MKRNLYFTVVAQRRNPIKDALLNFFLGISSYPRLLIEVFIRRDMGARYFNLFPVVLISLVLILLPRFYPFGRYGVGWWETMGRYWGWYLFTIGFMVFSYFRYQESKHMPGDHDSRYSRSAGRLLPFVKNLKFGAHKTNIRMLEIFVEPLLVVLCAVVFLLLQQLLIAGLLAGCAILYSLCYVAIYSQGDDFVLDKIDSLLCNRDMADAFKYDILETRSGFRFYGYKPDSKSLRNELYESMLVDADYVSEVTKA